MSFCKWFYETYREGIRIVSLFLIGCLGIYILFLMLTPFLPLFSNVPWTEYEWLMHLALYVEVCLCSILGLIAYFCIVEVYIGYMRSRKKKIISFKVKPQWIVYTVAMIIIFTYIGYNGGYGNGEADGYGAGFREMAEYASHIRSTEYYSFEDIEETIGGMYFFTSEGNWYPFNDENYDSILQEAIWSLNNTDGGSVYEKNFTRIYFDE